MSNPNIYSFLYEYLSQKKILLVGYILVGLIWAFDMAFSPYLLKSIIDSLILKTQPILPIGLMVTYVSMSLLLNLNFRFFDWLNLKLYPYLKGAIVTDLFALILNHSYSYFQNSYSGTLASKMKDLAVNAQNLISIPSIYFIPRVLALLGATMTLGSVVDRNFSFILFIWTLCFVWISFSSAKKINTLSRSEAAAFQQMDGPQ